MSDSAVRLGQGGLFDLSAPRIGAVEVAFLEVDGAERELVATWRHHWRDWRAHGHEAPRSIKMHDAFLRLGTDLAARAVRDALETAGLLPRDVDAVFFTTVTGLASPTIDARLVELLGLRRDVRRVPMFGLGSVGGAAGLARTSDHVRAFPEHAAVLVAVELCCDGAAAVVVVGAERFARGTGGRARIIATRSVSFHDSAEVPAITARELAPEIDAFLAGHGLSRRDVRHWICHPDGPEVLAAIELALGLAEGALGIARRSLAEVGDLSGASVLHVLAETEAAAHPGDVGVLLAMTRGFLAELVLLAW